MSKIKSNIKFRLIKILDIGYISLIFTILAIILAKMTNFIVGEFDKKDADDTPTYMLIFKSIMHIWLIGITCYFIRNVMEYIPSPFDGTHGFNHSMVKELNDMYLFAYIYLAFQSSFEERLQYIYNRLS